MRRLLLILTEIAAMASANGLAFAKEPVNKYTPRFDRRSQGKPDTANTSHAGRTSSWRDRWEERGRQSCNQKIVNRVPKELTIQAHLSLPSTEVHQGGAYRRRPDLRVQRISIFRGRRNPTAGAVNPDTSLSDTDLTGSHLVIVLDNCGSSAFDGLVDLRVVSLASLSGASPYEKTLRVPEELPKGRYSAAVNTSDPSSLAPYRSNSVEFKIFRSEVSNDKLDPHDLANSLAEEFEEWLER